MAKAYCCDRCGDYFKSKVIRDYVVGYPCGCDGSNLLDLCPKCSAQLMEFMKNPNAILVDKEVQNHDPRFR